MKPDVNFVRTYLEYNYGSHRKVWDCISHITDSQFVEDVAYSIGSIRNHYVHLIGVGYALVGAAEG